MCDRNISAWTLAGRVQMIIANHKEYRGLLRTCYPHIRKSNKCGNARGARAENRCQTYGIHRLIEQHVIQTLGTAINARTLAVHVAWIIAKHKEYICLLWTCYANIKNINKCVNARGARAENHCQTKEYIHLLRKCYLNFRKTNKCMNARGASAANHCQTQGIHRLTARMLSRHVENNKCVNARGARAENHYQT